MRAQYHVQVRCLNYALEMGADITLNSYGGLYADSYALQSAIEAADQKGQLFVTAAGNDYGTPNPPLISHLSCLINLFKLLTRNLLR